MKLPHQIAAGNIMKIIKCTYKKEIKDNKTHNSKPIKDMLRQTKKYELMEKLWFHFLDANANPINYPDGKIIFSKWFVSVEDKIRPRCIWWWLDRKKEFGHTVPKINASSG